MINVNFIWVERDIINIMKINISMTKITIFLTNIPFFSHIVQCLSKGRLILSPECRVVGKTKVSGQAKVMIANKSVTFNSMVKSRVHSFYNALHYSSVCGVSKKK